MVVGLAVVVVVVVVVGLVVVVVGAGVVVTAWEMFKYGVTTCMVIPQKFWFRLKRKKPCSPHQEPQEFLAIHSVGVYPTMRVS